MLVKFQTSLPASPFATFLYLWGLAAEGGIHLNFDIAYVAEAWCPNCNTQVLVNNSPNLELCLLVNSIDYLCVIEIERNIPS